MTQKKLISFGLIILVIIFTGVVLLKNNSNVQTEKINIIHTDAVKAQVLPEEQTSGVKQGGFALLSAGINYLQQKRKADKTIIIDAGSTLTGSVYSYYTQGRAVVELLNQMDYDALTIGNREFDFGFTYLKNALESAEFEPLSANLINKQNSSPPFKRYLIKQTKQGTKIGIIGLTYENMEQVTLESNVQGIKFKKVEVVLDKLLTKLKDKVDIMIVTSALKQGRARKIAYKYGEQIDLIIGRTRKYKFLETPVQVNGVDIVKTKGRTNSVGSYLFKYHPSQGIIKTDWTNLLVTSEYLEPDVELGNKIANYTSKLDQILGRVIGSSVDGISQGDRYGRESEIGNFLADILLEKTKAEIALLNRGGIRSGLEQKITKQDVFEVFPFPSSVVLLELQGQQIKSLLERSVTFNKGPLMPAGLSYSYDPAKPKGNRIVEVKVHGQQLKEEEYYEVATIDFLVEGGDGYTEFKAGRNINYTSRKMRSLISDYIENNSPVDAELDGRFVPIKGAR